MGSRMVQETCENVKIGFEIKKLGLKCVCGYL